MPIARLGTGNIAVSKTDMVPLLMQLTVQRERQYHYKNNIITIKKNDCEDTVQEWRVIWEHGAESFTLAACLSQAAWLECGTSEGLTPPSTDWIRPLCSFLRGFLHVEACFSLRSHLSCWEETGDI